MDLRQYFHKIRTLEHSFADNFPLIMSVETADGGRPGIATEVTPHLAAKAIVDGRAVLATDEEKAHYRQAQSQSKELAKQVELAKRLQVAIIADPELQKQFPGKNHK